MYSILRPIGELVKNICGCLTDPTSFPGGEQDLASQQRSEYQTYVMNLGVSQAHLISDISKLDRQEHVSVEEFRNLAISHRNLNISTVQNLSNKVNFLELQAKHPLKSRSSRK